MVLIDQRALITNSLGEVLLVKEEKDSDWDLPGGTLDGGAENWRENLENILEENLDLQVMTEQPFFAADFRNPANGEYMYMTIISCQVFAAEFASEKYAEVEWVKPEELPGRQYAAYDIKEAILMFTQPADVLPTLR